jgi:RNase P protein component
MLFTLAKDWFDAWIIKLGSNRKRKKTKSFELKKLMGSPLSLNSCYPHPSDDLRKKMTRSQGKKKKFGKFFARSSWKYKGTKNLVIAVRKKTPRDQYYLPYAGQIIFKASKASVGKKAVLRNRAIRRMRAAVQNLDQNKLKAIESVYQIMLISNRQTALSSWGDLNRDFENFLSDFFTKLSLK